ncbi:MAG: undecaprenyldiphospho-muramoylpentapeptide beta-N-acetylglucosaminyltransferase [Candidatus Gastranaerophilales bacterium]|nr:undecaprenyldiphospho-muramoylpentapeptide beta-N-acetylglucosaminyltransferase [Candidatus Gastranaerophilales bacterium]
MVNNNKKITVAITGGGTGGHIYPAVAVAQALKTDNDIEKVYYVGCPDNMEKEIAIKEELEFIPVSISGMPRKLGFNIIKWFLKLNKAVGDAIIQLKKIKPDVILGTGGYVSGPVLIAAIILRIPFVIHDPDAHPGIVNRFVSPWAKAVSVAFEEAKNYISSKNIIVNGNPIRFGINSIKKEEALKELNLDNSRKTILVMGGSQGAKTINNAILNAAPVLINDYNFQIVHQTGKKNYNEYIEQLSLKWPEYKENSCYIVSPYFDNMSIPLAAADLAISRAGSLSISELNLSSLPSILIPYPYAAADHQRYNAKALKKAGASAYLEDAECNQNNLIKMILEILNDEEKLKSMKTANNKLARPYATDNLVKIIKCAKF